MELVYKRGRKFLHRIRRNSHNEPSVCTIIRLMRGSVDLVYYRTESGANAYVPREQFYTVLLEWVK